MAKVEPSPAMQRKKQQSGPVLFVGIVTLLWATIMWRLAVPIGLVLATLWLLFNFYLWFVPGWRRNIVDRRGPLLGVGFAFAASLISAVADGLMSGWGTAVALFFIRWIVLTIPFVLPFTVKKTPYPHPIDLVVLVYALFLPLFPGFSQSWFLLAGDYAVTPGLLCALGLIATYFFGARTWTAAPLDLKFRPNDMAHAARTATYAVIGTVLGMLVAFFQTETTWDLAMTEGLGHVATHVFGGGDWSAALTSIVFALGFVVVAETLIFRSLLQGGIPHWLPEKIVKNRSHTVGIVAALLAAALHATLGVHGLVGAAGFGFALGLAWAFRKSRRFFPAVLGQAIALLVLAGLGLFFG